MSEPACIATPVSWLRLERYALGELAGAEARAIADHVAACPACRTCLGRIEGDARALPPLSAIAAPPPRRWLPRLAWAGGLAAAVAALLLVVLRPAPSEIAPSDHLRIKGGGSLVVSTVRERAGTITLGATTFAAGDRFKLRLTCSTPIAVTADIVVFQRDARDTWQPAFPLPRASLTCGNDVVLPGAFTITGPAPALACVSLAPDRTALTPLRPDVACVALAPDL